MLNYLYLIINANLYVQHEYPYCLLLLLCSCSDSVDNLFPNETGDKYKINKKKGRVLKINDTH